MRRLTEEGLIERTVALLAPDKLALDQARQVLAQRPLEGYGSTVAFWTLPAMARLAAPESVQQQTVAKTRWFEVALRADLGGDIVDENVLIDAGSRRAKLVRRQWGEGS